ncbi:ubiquitin-like protein Pup [Janibacter sp. GS2]|uniref:ubiquitin-like protein Pup n=1 Tax=Janibacter sp. GS2 TaxID=3442646 RepID=UPI003EBEFE22
MAQEQVRSQRSGGGDEGPADEGASQVAAQNTARDEGVDSVLDEIDGVLESNAEEFVKGFVQKGGQ